MYLWCCRGLCAVIILFMCSFIYCINVVYKPSPLLSREWCSVVADSHKPRFVSCSGAWGRWGTPHTYTVAMVTIDDKRTSIQKNMQTFSIWNVTPLTVLFGQLEITWPQSRVLHDRCILEARASPSRYVPANVILSVGHEESATGKRTKAW